MVYFGHSVATFLTGCLICVRHGGVVQAADAALQTTDNATHHSCQTDGDCGAGEEFVCRTLLCECKNDSAVFVKHALCLPGRRLGEDCEHEAQCRQSDSSAVCRQHHCKCPTRSEEVNATHCSSPSEDKSSSGYRGLDPNMIPIVVVLPIMFVGMCVALHLFSKARFRNRRTIFNSPHPRLMHIKLGRKKKRRTSHASLQFGSRRPSACSPIHSRTGSHVGSMNSLSGRTAAPIAQLETFPSSEAIDKKGTQNGPDILREAVVQNGGPSSPTVIVTTVRRVSCTSSDGQQSPSNAATRV